MTFCTDIHGASARILTTSLIRRLHLLRQQQIDIWGPVWNVSTATGGSGWTLITTVIPLTLSQLWLMTSVNLPWRHRVACRRLEAQVWHHVSAHFATKSDHIWLREGRQEGYPDWIRLRTWGHTVVVTSQRLLYCLWPWFTKWTSGLKPAVETINSVKKSSKEQGHFIISLNTIPDLLEE